MFNSAMFDLALFNYEFMRHAFLASGMVAVVAAAVGMFLVIRGQTFAGHALSHGGFSGATGAVLLGLPPLWGMVVVAVLMGAAMGAMGERLARRDVAIGMVLALSLGLGVLFLYFFHGSASQATRLLFGNVLGVDTATLWALAALTVVCLSCLAVIARPLLFASLQPELAAARGVPVRGLAIGFMALTGLATAQASEVVGVLLVFTLMIGPAATAQRLTPRIGWGLLLSAVLAVAEAWGGLCLSYLTDWPTSFWITALSAVVFVGAWLAVGLREWRSNDQKIIKNNNVIK